MNMEVRQPAATQKTRLKIFDVDIHPKSAFEDLKPDLSQTLVGAFADLRRRARAGISEGVSLSEEPAAGLAPR